MHRLALLTLPALMFGQTAPPPDARELVRESASAAKKFSSYEIESLVVVEMRGGPVLPRIEMPSSVRVRRPDKMRIESRSQAGSVTIVGDGEHTWYYLSSKNQFVKREATASPEAAMNNGGMAPKSLPDVSQSIESVKLAGEEAIEIEGRSYPCWKVQTAYRLIRLPEQNMTIEDGLQITWISKADGLNLKSSFVAKIYLGGSREAIEMTQASRTTALRLNVDLPDSTFVFTPPEGATEAEDGALPGIAKPDLIGKAAPALKAKAIDGAEIDLAAMKGKVVLLDFWATWCVPCRRELPNLEKLHKEFGDQVVVVGMNVGEEKSTVADFLKGVQISYPVAAIEDSAQMVADLAVTAYPTVVVVDREGKIASYEIGVRGEEGLRAALGKAGVTSK